MLQKETVNQAWFEERWQKLSAETQRDISFALIATNKANNEFEFDEEVAITPQSFRVPGAIKPRTVPPAQVMGELIAQGLATKDGHDRILIQSRVATLLYRYSDERVIAELFSDFTPPSEGERERLDEVREKLIRKIT